MKELLASPTFLKFVFSFFTILIIYLITLIIIRIINKSIKDLKRRYTARKFTVYIATIIWIFIIILIWIKKGAPLTTIVGFMGAGLTLALHQPVLSIAGWLLILIRRPYETGDRV